MNMFTASNVAFDGDYIRFHPIQDTQLFEIESEIPVVLQEIVQSITEREHYDQFVYVLTEFFDTIEEIDFSAPEEELINSRTAEFANWVLDNEYHRYIGTEMDWDEFHDKRANKTLKEESMNIRTDNEGRPYCLGTTKKNRPCNRIDVKENGYCAAHQDQAPQVPVSEVNKNLRDSLTQQSEETQAVVREAIRNITNNEEMDEFDMLNTFINEKREDYEFIAGGTGSRSLKNADSNTKAWVAHYLRYVLRQLKERYGDKLAVLSGLAEGFDELWALIAMELKIDLIAAIPSPTYGDYYWGKHSVTGQDRSVEFNNIVRYAKNTGGVVYVCEDFYGFEPKRPGKANFDRNQFMVDLATGFYAWQIGSRGTRDCILRIEQAGKRYVDIEARLPEYAERVTAQQ